MKILGQKFFEQPTLTVAEKMLGKYLCRRIGNKIIRAMITEVEAYDGPNDRASHASRGMTERNKVMFGPAGVWYVYFTYGMHWILNIVTGKKGYPAAVLIRAVIPKVVYLSRPPVSGPARVTKFFKVGKRFNGKRAGRLARLWIEDRGIRVKKSEIKKDRRVGIDYAGPIWVKKKYRFFYAHSPSPR